MWCASCGFDNTQGLKFCEECGTQLLRVCPSCGQQVRPTAKFCGECGTTLGAEEKRRAAKSRCASAPYRTNLHCSTSRSFSYGFPLPSRERDRVRGSSAELTP